MTTYYTLTPSGLVQADPQPVVVPEGYMVVRREPDEAMQYSAAHEVILMFHGEGGYCGKKAAIDIGRLCYRAMTQAGEMK